MKDETIAAMTFQDLIRTAYFWKRQWGFLAILVLGILLILGLWEFTYPNAEQLDKVSGMGTLFALGAIFIHPILLFGSWIMLRLLADIQIEQATARVIKNNVNQQLAEMERPGGISPDVEKIHIACVPERLGSKTDMALLFEQVQKDAKVRKFESPLVIAQPYQERLDSRLISLSGLQRYALTLGILGTFLGILLALTSIDKSMSNMSATSISNLLSDFGNFSGDIFNALRIAFRTSVAGLEVYLIIGGMLLYIEHQRGHYFFTMEEMTSDVLSLAKMAIKKGALIEEFRDVNTHIEEIKDELSQHKQQIDHNLKRVETRLDAQTEYIQQGLGRLKETKEDFDQFLEQLLKKQENFNQAVQNSYELFQGEVKAIFTPLSETEQSLTEQQQNFSQEAQKAYSSFQDEVKGLFKLLSETQHDFVKDIKAVYDLTSMKNLGEQLETNIKQIVGDLAQNFRTHLTSVDGNVSAIGASFTTLATNMGELVKQTDLINETLKEIKTTASEAAQANLQKQLEKMESLLQSITQITENTSSLSQVMAGSISENVGHINQHLQSFEQAASQQLSPQLQQIKTDMVQLRETIEKTKNNSQDLPKTLKEIAEAVKSMNIGLVDYQTSSIHTSNRILIWAGRIVVVAGVLVLSVGFLVVVSKMFF